MNRTQRRATQRAQRRQEAQARDRLWADKRRDVDRDLPASLQRLGLKPVNRGPYDADYPYDPERTPVIHRTPR